MSNTPSDDGHVDAGSPGADDETAFAALVARFDDEAAKPAWPSVEDVAALPEPGGPRPKQSALIVQADGTDGGRDEGALLDGPDDPSDHYEPPPPPPVPRMRTATRLALGAIAVGIAILLAPSVAGFEHTTPNDIAGVVLVLAGVATLVGRMGDGPPTDSDDGDDGAVV